MTDAEKNIVRDALVGAVEEFFIRLRKTPSVARPVKPKHSVAVNGAKRRGRPGVPLESVMRMRALKAKGLPAKQIAKQLGLSHFTVYKYTKA